MDDAKHSRMDFAALLRAAHGEALDAPGYQKRANRCVVEKYQRILGHQDVLAQTLVETMAAACECGGSGCECNCALLQIVIRQPCKDAIAHAIECGMAGNALQVVQMIKDSFPQVNCDLLPNF
jgi:hypothetical protein